MDERTLVKVVVSMVRLVVRCELAAVAADVAVVVVVPLVGSCGGW